MIPGVLFTGESLVPLGSVCASRRAGSHSLNRVTRPCDTVSRAPGRIDCGQLPRSRPTLSELSSELLSKSVRFESDVGAAEQAAQLLTSDIRIHPAQAPVKPFSNQRILLQHIALGHCACLLAMMSGNALIDRCTRARVSRL
jgi:hypothetical protein